MEEEVAGVLVVIRSSGSKVESACVRFVIGSTDKRERKRNRRGRRRRMDSKAET